ncbi:hypothetical protein UA38_04955 [Photobacterium kishitanii]|uniref:hypothetical protein n=1 Tax=Photobacterium kishitanii TaxID=318456 RepID=UPI0005D3A76B|nr:hypothetical protein [Photobacterium kishitanii]KJG59079.1 hypothetical protein UA38_04955 [Photobacterium kishitanii]PSV77939.1 hypothetical protein C0W29_01045 [Photobacterium kishitanii]
MKRKARKPYPSDMFLILTRSNADSDKEDEKADSTITFMTAIPKSKLAQKIGVNDFLFTVNNLSSLFASKKRIRPNIYETSSHSAT